MRASSSTVSMTSDISGTSSRQRVSSMPEQSARLPCPVCLGVVMEKVMVGSSQQLEIDLCRRCGGIWLEKGEVQGLREQQAGDIRQQIAASPRVQLIYCHECH